MVPENCPQKYDKVLRLFDPLWDHSGGVTVDMLDSTPMLLIVCWSVNRQTDFEHCIDIVYSCM